ncbi:hypothetical protein COUCH_01475 [Couchioplanes caeruleus]|uniref:hypothetical protein n=1 Tax=Couchioplanes caeruleus TaxID=56438 RepID=UPI0020C10AD1|nr:hypothetical protein [Couchioplanes caeruleus]UQU65057.1 hypothetical protein COUCH_01475 [Couchioplanes caeruleus]
MSVTDPDSPAERSGRLFLTSWFGAWAAASALEKLGRGELMGLALLGAAVVLVTVAAAMLRTDSRRDDPAWTRRDTYAVLAVLVGAAILILRGVLRAPESWAAAASPVWIALAVRYAVVRLRTVRRGRRQNVSRES